jgi:Skp family chaperone for outer membrane proteins
VKSSVVIVAGLATLGVVGYLASHLLAQGPAQVGATKVGVLNMRTVMKGYNKFQVLDNEIKQLKMEFDKRDGEIKKNAKVVQEVLAKGDLSPEKRDESEKYLITCKRALEDNNKWWEKTVGKKSEENVTQIYKEIEGAVGAYARENGYQMILAYYDMTADPEKYQPAFLQHKLEAIMGTSCAYPMYCANGMDVSADVVGSLNRHYQVPTPGASPAPNGPQK